MRDQRFLFAILLVSVALFGALPPLSTLAQTALPLVAHRQTVTLDPVAGTVTGAAAT
jgi:hypothetical protein